MNSPQLKLLLPLWSKSWEDGRRTDYVDDNVQLLQTPNLTGYRTPNDDIQTKREVENEA